jgi:hypothetical protein
VRQVDLPKGTPVPDLVGTDATSLIRGDRAAVDRLTIGPVGATLGRVLTIAHALPVAFDPGGRELLYLLGHSPPNLWTATLENHHLVQSRRLVGDPPVDAYAW